MEGSIDIKLLLSLGAMLVSVVSASVIVKQKLASVIEQLNDLKKDYESRLRSLDQRTDKQENLIDLNSQKTEVLSSILSPSKLESQHREIERISIMTYNNGNRIDRLEKMHNGSHPVVKERK
jgi:phosphoglycerate-specific signal transduction histidine kinase|tara:strand:+ start:630 stop:995 length:366 start_codon:yes stop_codon:yes gene_type:complete